MVEYIRDEYLKIKNLSINLWFSKIPLYSSKEINLDALKNE